MYVMCKTLLGRLAATDHCAHAVSEMAMLDRAWEELRAQRPDISLPVWDSLRKSSLQAGLEYGQEHQEFC